ncbi:MAG: hypothetical protein HY675_26600 [Chloroflexi bacterium]|nr:hypothetical protein [Chloroflexota bacterium]
MSRWVMEEENVGLLGRIQSIVERPIREKFRSAVPTHGGDRLLLTILGKTLSQPALAARTYGEGEIFLIKGGLFLSGVRLDPSAYEGVGTEWKEDLGQRHYDPDARTPRDRPLPHALNLPHGFYMPIYVDPTSPFVLRREGGTLYLYVDELRLFPVEYEARPAFYSKVTSAGVPMPHVGSHRLQRQLLVEYNAYCHFFAQKKACIFCGIVAERSLLPARYNSYFGASPAEVAEVVEAAYAEGVCTEMQVTGGVLPNRAEMPYFLEVGRAVKERLGVDVIPGSQAVLAPPSSPREIEELKEAGWQGVAFNVEIWDERLWPGMVPGKAALMPRERWLEALEFAVQVFGRGEVASVIVAGLEPKRSFLAGVEWLAQRGIYGVPIPWAPVPGSELEGHQTPTAAWHLEVVVKALDIWERYLLDAQRHSSGGLHYADLARMRQSLARDRERHTGRDWSKDLRHVLAVEGKLPEV